MEGTRAGMPDTQNPTDVDDGITSSCPPFPEEVWINILNFVRSRGPDASDTEQPTDAPPGQRDLARMMRVSSVGLSKTRSIHPLLSGITSDKYIPS